MFRFKVHNSRQATADPCPGRPGMKGHRQSPRLQNGCNQAVQTGVSGQLRIRSFGAQSGYDREFQAFGCV